MGICSTVTLILLAASTGGLILMNNYQPFEVYVNGVVGDLTYPTLRMWRLMTLPLHKFFDLEPYARAECLVDNRFYVPG